jgi:hypothetical protein
MMSTSTEDKEAVKMGWGRVVVQLFFSTAFLGINAAVLLLILRDNRRKRTPPREPAPPAPPSAEHGPLPAVDILSWEFEYTRVTASEAMEQRHTMVNFYLLAAGVVASGVLAVLAGETALPPVVGAVLLWLLCGIGWIYFLSIIRLRQSWHESVRAMNAIKDFYVRHAEGFEPDVLRSAFRWRSETLPEPDKPWSVFHYSALLIALIDSVAYVAGGLLLNWGLSTPILLPVTGYLALLGVAFFALHAWLYTAFLKRDRPSEAIAAEIPHE